LGDSRVWGQKNLPHPDMVRKLTTFVWIVPDAMLSFKLTSTDEKITSHAGLGFVAEAFEALHLPARLARALPQPGSAIGYVPSQLVMVLVLMLIGGGHALDHIRQIANDGCLRKLLGLERFPDAGTIGDWLRRSHEKGYAGLRHVIKSLNSQILMTDKRLVYTLDPDATAIESHKTEAKMTYKGFPGYMPMLATLAEVPIFLVDDFREGNVPPGAYALEFLDEAISSMPKDKQIGYLRSDSAWYQAAVFNRCKERNIIFAITADKDKAVMQSIDRISKWHPYVDRDNIQTDREWGEVWHTMNDTKWIFRLIVQRWKKPNSQPNQLSLFGKEYCYHAIATNHTTSAVEVIYWHNHRASAENFNKEIKIGYGMEHLPCGDFTANSMYFRIGILAYNIMIAIKYLWLPEEHRHQTIATMRWLWIHTAAKLVRHGRRWILKIANQQQQLIEWWERLRRGPPCLA
jgi:hypothetical protein